MKPIRFLHAAFIALIFLIVGGCDKSTTNTDDTSAKETEYIAFCDLVHNTDDGNYLDIAWFTFDGTVIDADKKENAAQKYSFTLDGDVTYSYQVREKISGQGGVISSTNKKYEGTLKESAFNETQLNRVEVVRDGSEWKLFVNGQDADVAGGGNNTSTEGVWLRYNSPNGYNTDLAIGGIPGEPANRVYMCEHPGSPSAGLYKGTISGEVITWDAVHGLPNAKFYERDGVMRLWFTVGPEDEAGRYKKGAWTNTCSMTASTGKKIAVGFNKSENQDVNLSINSIKIENVNCPITMLSASVPAPECTSGKFITPPTSSANPDYYMVSITYSSLDLNSQPYTKTEQSIIYKTHLIDGCNKFKADNSGTGRWVLLPL